MNTEINESVRKVQDCVSELQGKLNALIREFNNETNIVIAVQISEPRQESLGERPYQFLNVRAVI